MKKVNYLFVLFAIVFFSCEDDIDNLTETEVSTTLTESFNVSVAEGGALTQSLMQSLNAGDNDDIKSVLSSVEGYEVNSVTFTITDYVGANDIMLESTMVTFEVVGGSSILATAEDVVISDVVGVAQDLPFNANALTSLGETLLTNGGTVDIGASSTVSGSPVSFTITINVEVTATIDLI